MKIITRFLFLFFALFLVASYFVSNTVGKVFAIIACVMFFLYLISSLFLNIKSNSRLYKIIFNILKLVLFILLMYLSIKNQNTIDIDTRWEAARYIDKVGLLLVITVPLEALLDNKIKSQ